MLASVDGKKSQRYFIFIRFLLDFYSIFTRFLLDFYSIFIRFLFDFYSIFIRLLFDFYSIFIQFLLAFVSFLFFSYRFVINQQTNLISQENSIEGLYIHSKADWCTCNAQLRNEENEKGKPTYLLSSLLPSLPSSLLLTNLCLLLIYLQKYGQK